MGSLGSFGNWIQGFLDWIFPFICVACSAPLERRSTATPICETCSRSVLVNSAGVCSVCRARLPRGSLTHHHKKPGCTLYAVTDYRNQVVENAITAYKYSGIRSLEPFFRDKIRIFLKNPDILRVLNRKDLIIVPIPLHYRKQNERGFNQSDVLAAHIKSALEASGNRWITINTRLLTRRRMTSPQAKQKGEVARLRNVSRCFRLNGPVPNPHSTYLIVDDVCTSLATMNEARRTLQAGGAKKIISFVFALA